MTKSARRRVVVTGIGAITPLGKSVESTWRAVRAGKSGIRPITRFDASGLRSRIAGEIDELPPIGLAPVRETRRMDRFMLLGFVAAEQAMADARLTITPELAPEVGVIMGSAIGGLSTIEASARIVLEQGAHKLTPFLLPATLINMLAGHLSVALGLRGYCACTVSACASSAHAIGDAARMIECGHATAMLVGGSESAITPLCVGGFAAMRVLSMRNELPERASRPFDLGRDGFVVSEGAAALVLEDREFALARGARIHAELAGYGFSADAQHMAAPSEEGPALAMRRALREAGLQPSDIDYVNAHATGTPVGDASEARAIRSVLMDGGRAVVGSTKAMTGHLLGAAGALEAILCIRAMQESLVPPSINLEDPDPECALPLAPRQAESRSVRAALSNSFGFGGTNASLLFTAPGAFAGGAKSK